MSSCLLGPWASRDQASSSQAGKKAVIAQGNIHATGNDDQELFSGLPQAAEEAVDSTSALPTDHGPGLAFEAGTPVIALFSLVSSTELDGYIQ